MPKAPEPTSVVASVNLFVIDTVPRPLAGARVEITHGEDAGTFVTTGADGRVTVKGRVLPSGGLRVRISKDGLQAVERQFGGFPSQTHQVTLIPNVLLNLAGEYLLTIEADPACEGLPPLARSRTYNATLKPSLNPSYFHIQLAGASFFRDFSYLGVFVGSDALRFEVYLPPLDEEPIVEQLSPDTYVAFIGDAEGDVNPGDPVVTTRLLGQITYCAATPAGPSFICPIASVDCRSDKHRLTMTRR